MKTRNYVRQAMLALAGVVVGMMSVSLIFDLAIYLDPQSKEAEQNATQYYLLVRSSFVPYIVTGTLISLVILTIYRVIFVRNWRTLLISIGIFGLSIYYISTVFDLEDNLPYLNSFEDRINSLVLIGLAHLLTWLAGWITMILLIPESNKESKDLTSHH